MLKCKFERLDGYIKFRGINLKQFAAELGFTPALISQIRSGKIRPTRKFIEHVMRVTGEKDLNALFEIEEMEKVDA